MHIEFKESGNFRDLPHLFHFLELVFVLITNFENLEDFSKVSKISFPQWNSSSWKGKEHPHNAWIIASIFKNAKVYVTCTDSVPDITIDRADLDKAKINKSWAKCIRHFDPYLWSTALYGKLPLARYRLLEMTPSFERKPVVTYISRQSAMRRTLDPRSHAKIIEFLGKDPRICFEVAEMEKLSWEEQVQLSKKTDLLIGVHGNGLSHAAFMLPHRNVVEIYTPGMQFHWDYYTLSKMMGHEYLCIFDNNIVMPQAFSIQNRICLKDDNIPIEAVEPIICQIIQEK